MTINYLIHNLYYQTMNTINLLLIIFGSIIGWEHGKKMGKLAEKYIISKFKD
jgi:hypothetical protein